MVVSFVRLPSNFGFPELQTLVVDFYPMDIRLEDVLQLVENDEMSRFLTGNYSKKNDDYSNYRCTFYFIWKIYTRFKVTDFNFKDWLKWSLSSMNRENTGIKPSCLC